ncbi:MAG: flagellar motor protein MotB [Rhodospirillaceae bacterium]
MPHPERAKAGRSGVRLAGTLRAGGRGGSAPSAPPTGAAAKSIWLISFTDLMCLMLAFFVLAFSMSEPVRERWQALASSFSARQIEGRTGAVFNVSMLNPRSPINLDYLATLLGVQFARDPDLGAVEASRQDDRVVIGLPDSLLFEPGQAAFSERGRQALFLLGGVLGHISNRIEVLGHAEVEAVPAEGERDSWELSLSRAVAVGTALHQAGYQRRLAVRTVGAAAHGVPLVGRAHLIDVVVRDLEEGS